MGITGPDRVPPVTVQAAWLEELAARNEYLQALKTTCRACNVRCANILRAAGIGRVTRQYNPTSKGATSLGQWLTAVFAMKGQSQEMTIPAAVEMIRATPLSSGAWIGSSSAWGRLPSRSPLSVNMPVPRFSPIP